MQKKKSMAKVMKVWNTATPNERHGFLVGLFPAWVQKHNLNRYEFAELVELSENNPQARQKKKCDFCGHEAKILTTRRFDAGEKFQLCPNCVLNDDKFRADARLEMRE